MADFWGFRWFALLVLFGIGGCSSISLESAKSLSSAGESFTVQAKAAVFVSESEFQLARDSEALMHGYSNTTTDDQYQEILSLSEKLNGELSKRAAVLDKLGEVYSAFGSLAAINTAGDTESAIDKLGASINEYATARGKEQPVKASVAGVISKVGGVTAGEIQKRRVKEVSVEIRLRLIVFKNLLADPLVASQMQSYKSHVGSSYGAAVRQLWDSGLYDPTQLLNDFGSVSGMTAQKDALKTINSSPPLQRAFREFLAKRQEQKLTLIAESYDSTLSILGKLIGDHEKLEKGEELNLARIREMTARLKEIVSIISKAKAGDS
ncbi:hypothetical protein PS925_04488 [Pseudomonas fluorescens]|uniref:Uncharacterized protein n=1 Tax=Pseudomonas fluorescens TaxID=294 RepID=A0A5E7V6Y1_PSEFL|nr:hypothetical protein [Pseudomonas fluorescens]VVQ18759.1 hypothetical protein PS925_04488 [Pseudomonas fluorescens]